MNAASLRSLIPGKREARDPFKCYERTDGYLVTEINHAILQDLISSNPYPLQEFFNLRSADLASSCELFAYKAMYEDLINFRREHPDAKALQFTMLPFSDKSQARLNADATYTFLNTPEDAFTPEDRRQYENVINNCNAKNMFSDSALVFTDAKYYNKAWLDSLNGHKAGKYTYTNFLKCAIAEAYNDAPDMCVSDTPDYDPSNDCCSGYLQTDPRDEKSLTNVGRRKHCPMIPDFKEYSNNKGITPEVITNIARAFVDTIDKFETKTAVPYSSTTWEERR